MARTDEQPATAARDDELFIVEGLSASNAVRNVVDRSFQEVFAMQGKPINVARASASQIQKNERAEALYRRITRNKSDAFDPSYVPFERVILLTDGDPDGVHAKALLLLLIHREVPDLIEQEQLLTVRAPQYGITCDQRTHPVFAYSIEGRDSVIRQLDQRGATSIHTHHYKGLAGMDRDDLWRHCVSVEDRELSLLTLDHVRAAQRALS